MLAPPCGCSFTPAAAQPQMLFGSGRPDEVAYPRDDARPTHLVDHLDARQLVAAPDNLAGRDVEAVDDRRDEGTGRGQFLSFDLKPIRGDVAQSREPEVRA